MGNWYVFSKYIRHIFFRDFLSQRAIKWFKLFVIESFLCPASFTNFEKKFRASQGRQSATSVKLPFWANLHKFQVINLWKYVIFLIVSYCYDKINARNQFWNGCMILLNVFKTGSAIFCVIFASFDCHGRQKTRFCVIFMILGVEKLSICNNCTLNYFKGQQSTLVVFFRKKHQNNPFLKPEMTQFVSN